jgi:alkyldihydroxyacetonephosphate synthase
MTKLGDHARISGGANLTHIALGQEGNLGIITEAVFRLRPLPESTEYESIVFPSFEQGLRFAEAVVKTRIWPTSMRLIDEKQLGAAKCLKEQNTFWSGFVEAAGEYFLQYIKGFEIKKMVACTLVFEGTREEVARQKKNIYSLYKKYHGVLGGASHGLKGYQVLFSVAYLRDFFNSLG